MKHVAIYIRVSTKQQDTKSQEPDLKRYEADQSEPVRWYSDKFTGKTMNRPGWQKLQAALRAGQLSRLVVWRLDRLGRTVSGLAALFDELQTRKVNLVSLKDGVDLSTPAGRLIANVLASVAQYETEVRGERVAAGQAVAKANGKRWGGDHTSGKLLHVTKEQLAQVHRLHAAGEGKSAIARATGLSRPTIYRLISRAVATCK